MFGVYVVACAGGHLNPAVTFVNTPWIGMKRVIRPNRKGIMEAIHGPPEKEV